MPTAALQKNSEHGWNGSDIRVPARAAAGGKRRGAHHSRRSAPVHGYVQVTQGCHAADHIEPPKECQGRHLCTGMNAQVDVAQRWVAWRPPGDTAAKLG